jgi:glucose-1-phosphate thymidylyltransferase
LKQNNNISYEKITDYWKDTGTPEDILHANGEIIAKHPEFVRRHDSGKIILGENSEIESNVKIVGPVIIGNNCKILANSSIGPNVSVGDNSTICVSSIENSIIMENCNINSVTKIKDSIVASNSEIKDNSLNDEKIFLLGEGSKISL